MLATWTEILPLFIVRWLAVRHCQRVHVGNKKQDRVQAAMARPDVLIRIPCKKGQS